MMCGLRTFSATLYAARNLKLPVRWNVSVARNTSRPRCAARRGASTMVVGRGESEARSACVSSELAAVTARGTAIEDSDMRWARLSDRVRPKHNEWAKQPRENETVASSTGLLFYSRARCDGASHPAVLARR